MERYAPVEGACQLMHLALIGIASQLLVFGALACWARLAHAVRLLWIVAVLGFIVVGTTAIASQVIRALHDPPTWDYRCFWLYARAVVLAHQPYRPEAMRALDAFPAPPAKSLWRAEVLDVGMVYPPPTALLFAPLGFVRTLAAGIPPWYAMLIAALSAEIAGLMRACFRRFGAIGLLGAAALVLSFPATVQTFAVAQTVFLLTLFVIVYWRSASPWIRGAALGLAFIVKPVAIVLLLSDVAAGRWRSVLSTLGIVFAATVLVVPLIGISGVVSYVTDSPFRRFPASVLAEPTEQSLLAALLRATHPSLVTNAASAMHLPAYLIISSVLVVITVTALRRVSGDVDLEIGLLLPLALLVYPQSLYFYSEVMLIPICIAWMRRDILPGGIVPVFAIAAAVSIYPFWGWLMTWALFMACALQTQPLRESLVTRALVTRRETPCP